MKRLHNKMYDNNNIAEAWRVMYNIRENDKLNYEDKATLQAAMNILAKLIDNSVTSRQVVDHKDLIPLSQWCAENNVSANLANSRIKQHNMPHILINGKRYIPKDYIFLDNRYKARIRIYCHKSLDIDEEEAIRFYQTATMPDGVSIHYYNQYLIVEPDGQRTYSEPVDNPDFKRLR